MTSPDIVLGSSSPYRRALLEKLGLRFECASPNIDETPHVGETPKELVARLAREKASAIAQSHPRSLIIASDQIALLEGEILGKPGGHEEAARQLRNSSGKVVTFLTSLALLNSASQTMQLEVVPYSVHFRHLSETQIEHYLRAEQPYNCAGSFKSEGLGIALFEKLEGDDPNTLIGLPLIRLVKMFEQEGVYVI